MKGLINKFYLGISKGQGLDPKLTGPFVQRIIHVMKVVAIVIQMNNVKQDLSVESITAEVFILMLIDLLIVVSQLKVGFDNFFSQRQCFDSLGQCVVDTPLRLLTHFVDLGGNVSPERCIEACSTLEKPGPKPKIPGYVFAGVENGNECFCGNSNISSVWHAPSSECNSPCSGNSNKICGGKMRMNIYETGLLWTDGESEDLNLQALPKCKSVGTFKNTESFSGYKSYKYFPQKQKNCFQFEGKIIKGLNIFSITLIRS